MTPPLEANSADSAEVCGRADTLRRYKFFREYGGSLVGENARMALKMARVEQLLDRAVDLDVAHVDWHYDDEPYDPGDIATDDEARAKFESNEWTGPFGCVLTIAGDHAASLWGIVMGPRATDDPYARTIVADLAYEAENELRQAIGDALDARDEIPA